MKTKQRFKQEVNKSKLQSIINFVFNLDYIDDLEESKDVYFCKLRVIQ